MPVGPGAERMRDRRRGRGERVCRRRRRRRRRQAAHHPAAAPGQLADGDLCAVLHRRLPGQHVRRAAAQRGAGAGVDDRGGWVLLGRAAAAAAGNYVRRGMCVKCRQCARRRSCQTNLRAWIRGTAIMLDSCCLPPPPLLQLVSPDGVLDRNFSLLGPGDTAVRCGCSHSGVGVVVAPHRVPRTACGALCAHQAVCAARAAACSQPTAVVALNHPVPLHRRGRCSSRTRPTVTSSGPAGGASARRVHGVGAALGLWRRVGVWHGCRPGALHP